MAALRSGTPCRCLADASDRPAACEGRPLLLVSLDIGTVLSPLRGSKGAPRPRPTAAAFLARLQSEAGLSVAAFSSAGPTEAAAARAAAVESQHPGFHFDFII